MHLASFDSSSVEGARRGGAHHLAGDQSQLVTAVDLKAQVITARMDDGAVHVLSGEDLGADRLSHSYALPVHRSLGATVDTCHRLADGGGRELAYVAMSRARSRSVVYTVADNVDQAVDELVRDWGHDRRPRWAIDTGTPKTRAEMAIKAQTVRQVEESIEVARTRHLLNPGSGDRCLLQSQRSEAIRT